MGSSESMNNVDWDTTKQKEIQDLHHYAISNLIPRAGVYQMKLLESLAQSASIYSPEETETLYNETNKKIEEISSHISGVLVSARELCKSGHQNWESVQSLRYHMNRLNGIIESV